LFVEPQEDGVNSKRSGEPHQSQCQPSTPPEVKKINKKEAVSMESKVVLFFFFTVYGTFVVQEAETECLVAT
jgi:hypothetical protein